MSENNTPDETQAVEEETQETPAPESAEEQPDQEKESKDAEPADDLEGLPDWAQKEIKRLRAENASKRIDNNQLREQLANASSAEEYKTLAKELETRLAKAERDATVAELARKHNIPDAAVALLTAQDPEELEAQVLAIAALTQGRGPASPPPLKPTGGRDPLAPPAADPTELYKKAKGLIKNFG